MRHLLACVSILAIFFWAEVADPASYSGNTGGGSQSGTVIIDPDDSDAKSKLEACAAQSSMNVHCLVGPGTISAEAASAITLTLNDSTGGDGYMFTLECQNTRFESHASLAGGGFFLDASGIPHDHDLTIRGCEFSGGGTGTEAGLSIKSPGHYGRIILEDIIIGGAAEETEIALAITEGNTPYLRIHNSFFFGSESVIDLSSFDGDSGDALRAVVTNSRFTSIAATASDTPCFISNKGGTLDMSNMDFDSCNRFDFDGKTSAKISGANFYRAVGPNPLFDFALGGTLLLDVAFSTYPGAGTIHDYDADLIKNAGGSLSINARIIDEDCELWESTAKRELVDPGSADGSIASVFAQIGYGTSGCAINDPPLAFAELDSAAGMYVITGVNYWTRDTIAWVNGIYKGVVGSSLQMDGDGDGTPEFALNPVACVDSDDNGLCELLFEAGGILTHAQPTGSTPFVFHELEGSAGGAGTNIETFLRYHEPGTDASNTIDFPDDSGVVALHGGAATHGLAGWGDGSASFDIGDEVCAGLQASTCQTTIELDGTVQNCTYDHSPNYFHAFCY